MDGAVGLTQCAIAPSNNFTYRYRIDESQSGTYWSGSCQYRAGSYTDICRCRYHAHSGVQRADGLFGGLIIHKPSLAERQSDLLTHQYETEQLLLVGDWYHRQAGAVLGWYQDSDHYMYEVRFTEPSMLLCRSTLVNRRVAFANKHCARDMQPAPDSLLINGKGWYNCSMAVKARPINCSETERPSVVLRSSQRVRLRVVNTG